MIVRYTLGCDLSYEVKSPTVFIFNLEVARLVRHHDLVERLVITPDQERRIHVVPDIRNRYFSIEAQPGRSTYGIKPTSRWTSFVRTRTP